MYMKTENSNQTVHNGFGQFPEIVQLRTRHSRHYLQFHILSLLPMTVQTYFFLYLRTMRRLAIQPFHLARNNATSCNPALPVVPLSVSRFYSTPQDAISLFFYVLAQTQITTTHSTNAHSKTLRIKAYATHAIQLSSPSHL